MYCIASPPEANPVTGRALRAGVDPQDNFVSVCECVSMRTCALGLICGLEHCCAQMDISHHTIRDYTPNSAPPAVQIPAKPSWHIVADALHVLLGLMSYSKTVLQLIRPRKTCNASATLCQEGFSWNGPLTHLICLPLRQSLGLDGASIG